MKVAIISGAASGIGLALSQIYLKQEVLVVMVDKNPLSLERESQRFLMQYPEQVLAYACDVSDEQAVASLAKQVHARLGRVDWLYNNAGIVGDLAPLWDLGCQSLRQVMDVNLFGMIHMIKAFSPFLFEQDFRSHIVNIASLFALCTASQTSAYSMSKHAVLALTESLYFDLSRLNKPVDLSVVFPSFTDTSLLSQNAANPFSESLRTLLAHSKKAEELAEHIVKQVAKKRFYILPDREVKTYCEERVQSIIMQEDPHIHSIEKLMTALIKRTEREH